VTFGDSVTPGGTDGASFSSLIDIVSVDLVCTVFQGFEKLLRQETHDVRLDI